jgi:hypothetical protein
VSAQAKGARLVRPHRTRCQWQVLQEPEVQLPQELALPLEVEVNLPPTLAVQALISFSTLVWPQWGHSIFESDPKTSFSKSWLQLWQWNSKMGII